MIDACEGARELFLVDPEIENKTIISLFFGLVLNVELDLDVLPPGTSIIPTLTALHAFCDKYECTIPRRTALVFLRRLDLDMTSHERFVIGAIWDDPDTCAKALQRSSTGMQDLAPSRIPLKFYSLISHSYLWALNRAWTNPNLPGAFLEYLKEAKGDGEYIPPPLPLAATPATSSPPSTPSTPAKRKLPQARPGGKRRSTVRRV
jgi:hypothetical protein